MSNNKKNTQETATAIYNLLQNFAETQDINLLQQGLMQSMRYAVQQAEEQCHHDSTTNIVQSTLDVCALLDALFKNKDHYSPFQHPTLSLEDNAMAENFFQRFSPHKVFKEHSTNSQNPQQTHFYRNNDTLISQQGIEVDPGSLWQKHDNILVLVNDDEYITHDFETEMFTQTTIS